jgi:hypothetical protein
MPRRASRCAIRRWGTVGAVCAVAFAAVCLVAVLDHSHKHRVRAAAQRDAWFCRHGGTHCGGASPAAIEASWNRRERAYVVAVGVLGAAVLASTAGAVRIRSRSLT